MRKARATPSPVVVETFFSRFFSAEIWGPRERRHRLRAGSEEGCLAKSPRKSLAGDRFATSAADRATMLSV